MVQKSGVHQWSLVVYPIIYRVLAPSQVVQVCHVNVSFAWVEIPKFTLKSPRFLVPFKQIPIQKPLELRMFLW